MAALHNDINAHIARSRSKTDGDVAVEELEAAVARIDNALGTEFTADVPSSDQEADILLNEARTCIRNDDLVGTRIRLLQVIAMGGGSRPPLDKNKPLDKMSKAELHAYAKARGYDVSQSNSKAGLRNVIEDLDAEADSGTFTD